jgi:hypothetical protein
VFRSRYVEGEWVSISGDIFRSGWFHRTGAAPQTGIRRVGVDLNASIKTHADFTAVVETVTRASLTRTTPPSSSPSATLTVLVTVPGPGSPVVLVSICVVDASAFPSP